MTSWLFEGRRSVYVLLAVIAALLLYQAWLRRHPKLRRQSRIYLAGALCVGLVGVGYHALDRLVESDREQVESRVQAMAESVKAGDLDAAFRYISDQFRSPGGRNKAAFLDLAKSYRRDGTVTEVIIWDFQYPEGLQRTRRTNRVSFQVKARGNLGRADALFARCEAEFDFSPADGWRLQGFQLFDPMRENERMGFSY